MNKFIPSHLTEEQKLSIPAASVTLFLCVLFCIESFNLPINIEYRQWLFICGSVGSIYVILMFFWVLPLIRRHAMVKWAITLLNGILVSSAMLFEPLFGHGL
ncbi:MAG TPA: hypothetical protein VF338_02340, partial [Leptolinea sp.]